MNIEIKKLHDDAYLPSRNSSGDAGYDLYAIGHDVVRAGERKLVSTGVSIAIPHGYYGRIAPRSGLALNHGIDILAGVIDSGYRGELLIPLINHSSNEYTINKTERVAQLILIEIPEVKIEVTSDLDESDRNSKGFGSTG